jgi:hypothetical protein
LIAATIVLFALGYVLCQRQEIRGGKISSVPLPGSSTIRGDSAAVIGDLLRDEIRERLKRLLERSSVAR